MLATPARNPERAGIDDVIPVFPPAVGTYHRLADGQSVLKAVEVAREVRPTAPCAVATADE